MPQGIETTKRDKGQMGIRNRLTYAFLFLFTVSLALFDVTQQAHAKAPAEAGEHAPIFLNMKPITVSVINEGIITNHLTYMMTLKVEGEANKELVEKMYPIIKSELVRYFHIVASSRKRGKLDDIEFVKSRVQRIANKVMGKTVVQEVFFKGKGDTKVS